MCTSWICGRFAFGIRIRIPILKERISDFLRSGRLVHFPACYAQPMLCLGSPSCARRSSPLLRLEQRRASSWGRLGELRARCRPQPGMPILKQRISRFPMFLLAGSAPDLYCGVWDREINDYQISFVAIPRDFPRPRHGHGAVGGEIPTP